MNHIEPHTQTLDEYWTDFVGALKREMIAKNVECHLGLNLPISKAPPTCSTMTTFMKLGLRLETLGGGERLSDQEL